MRLGALHLNSYLHLKSSKKGTLGAKLIPEDKKRGRSPYKMSDAHKDAIRVSNILAREKIEIKRARAKAGL